MQSIQKRRRFLASRIELSSRLRNRKKKTDTNYVVRVTFAIIAGFAFLPLLYLHHRLTTTTAVFVEHKAHHIPVHKNLGDFYGLSKSSNSRRDRHKHSKRARAEEHHQSRSTHLADQGSRRKVLTAYLEPIDTVISDATPLPLRNTTASRLKQVEFPHVASCDSLMQDFPIDDYPTEDPFLPWIHDYFPSLDGKFIKFVAQNRRRCDTGEEHLETMKFWEPQIALLQPIPVVAYNNGTYRLAASHEEATHNATRFQCRFHANGLKTTTTLSIYPFDYEYVTWRKTGKEMFDREGGKDMSSFWLSQMLFSCPVPFSFRELLVSSTDTKHPVFHLDLVPIRTLVRSQFFLDADQTGPQLGIGSGVFDAAKNFGTRHFLPDMDDAGRWGNLPICDRQSALVPAGETSTTNEGNSKQYTLVGCTWTSASYTRRGDAVRISDSPQRLEEWILFHFLVGFDHVYIYDNTDGNSTVLKDVADRFPKDKVTYHRWPCHICNNNRPANKNPGERSSQYAAEASCRERYGPLTEWMTFLDTDEYLVPLKASQKGDYIWKTILDEMDRRKMSVLKFLSSRARPRVDLMQLMEDQSICVDPWSVKGPNKNKTEPCLEPKRGETFLKVYNCEYIRHPKPNRFARAMKQIYRTSHVHSHFVHYSTVTEDVAETYSKHVQTHPEVSYIKSVHDKRWQSQSPELFLDGETEGALVHARSVLPHETRRRSAECFYGSKFGCMIGHICEDSVKFIDALHKNNSFRNQDGSYCNCWKNTVLEDVLIPKLENLIRDHRASSK